ncbi:MAG: plasmid maintenance protein CcdB [Alphaproteobacteria bacterium]|nr:plasmid maintenance protein CcdB [Alphaproteobacteria bacterium]
MARFDVHARRGGDGYLLDCQANLLDDLNTRFVVPLLRETDAPRPAARLNPWFEIDGRRVLMVTQFASAVGVRELGEKVGSLAERQEDILNALDMLISGF